MENLLYIILLVLVIIGFIIYRFKKNQKKKDFDDIYPLW